MNAMSEQVIEVQNVSKYYTLTHQLPYGTLRDALTELVAKPFRRSKRANRSKEQFAALEDISFSVQQEERIGIIGRNGAGKSTLLKILSRITAPSSGTVKLRGRVVSLLEVGTGFNPELTGRENIFLNGAILGMKQKEIRKRFDEIVAFSEIEQFLDTPVKRYSSGMYVRLAFAVAAHLEAEILIVDEVLAVGDALFQKKCLGKMTDVAGQGRTVIFVSHNMPAVKKFCSKCILLDHGRLLRQGQVDEVVNEYLSSTLGQAHALSYHHLADAPGNEAVKLMAVHATTPDGKGGIDIDSGVQIATEFYMGLAGKNLDLTMYLQSGEGVTLFESGTFITTNHDSRKGYYRSTVGIPGNLLNAGTYSVSLLWGEDQRIPLFRLDDAISFEVKNTLTGRGNNLNRAPGVIRPLLKWSTQFQP